MFANKIIFSSDSHFEDGLVYQINNITDVADSPYQITSSSGLYGGNELSILVSTTSPITINLPTDEIDGCENGRFYYILSAVESGTNITINSGNNQINGGSSIVLNDDSKSASLIFCNVTSEWYLK